METSNLQRLTFEEGYDRLDQVISQLEAGELTLQESVALYEEGIQLARHCEHKLDDAELKVSELLNTDSEQGEQDVLF